MNILFIKTFFVGFIVSEISRVSVLGYFPLVIYIYIYTYIYLDINIFIIIIGYSQQFRFSYVT